MKTLTSGKSIAVLHNNRKGNNYRVAKLLGERYGCAVLVAEDDPDIAFDTVILVVSNTGDEELPQPMEDYLFHLRVRDKQYAVCELGNYFGFENYCGCKKVAFRILDDLGWKRLSDVSLDSLPTLDEVGLLEWLLVLDVQLGV